MDGRSAQRPPPAAPATTRRPRPGFHSRRRGLRRGAGAENPRAGCRFACPAVVERDGWSTAPHHQRVVVIGGTSGIGFAVAEPALAEGAEVVVASRSPERVAASLKRPPDQAAGLALDVTGEGAVAESLRRGRRVRPPGLHRRRRPHPQAHARDGYGRGAAAQLLPWPPGPSPARCSRPPPLAHSLRKAPLKYLHEGI
ncbi:SDR family NAD(P)-dependent oxidoreductase [Streptomyces justiciae]|uniref:SDR family NAD(P)-dependent oxidoreductase n=1 Tax=Streptomyces justiciae TaxID=2780140 RepID=UPI003908A644